MRKVLCNVGCQQEFIVVQAGSVMINEDVERVGFDCPHCGQTYTLYFLNHYIRTLQEQQKRLMKESGDAEGRVLKGILQKIKNNKYRIEKEMKKLREVYEKSIVSSM